MNTPLTTRHNLPQQPTSFIGRQDEIAEITALLADPNCRLLTLVGPGGIGKTRLAIEVVSRLTATSFTDGIFYVPLAPLTSADPIVTTVINVLGIHVGDTGMPREELLNFLSERHLLLVMDNFEHVLAGADLVADIIHTAAKVKILATSREVLNLRIERVWSVEGLLYPEIGQQASADQYSALKLFVDRATWAQRAFSPADEQTCVIRICQLVDGNPLALELAASWLKTLSCGDVLNQLQCGIDFLTTRARDIPERHRSIRAVFDHSWQLLSDDERAVFRCLAVFRGGFTLEAAEKVGGASLMTLSGLVEKSMIRRDNTRRYDVHELLRQYAGEKLAAAGEAKAIHDAHKNYYADFMQEHAIDIKGRRQLGGLNEIEADFENVRVAWKRAVEQADYIVLDRMMEGIALFCDMRSKYHEGDDLLRDAVERLATGDNAVHPTWNRLRARWAQVLVLPEENPKAVREQAEPAFVLAQALNDHETEALCLWILGESNRFTFVQSQQANAIRLYEEALIAFRELEDDYYVGRTLRAMAHTKMVIGSDYREASLTINRQHLEVTQAIGDRTGMAHAIHYEGVIAYQMGYLSEAERYFQEASITWEEMGDRKSVGVAKNFLGWVYLSRANIGSARKLAQEALEMLSDVNYQGDKVSALFNLGIIAVIEGDYRAGWRLSMEGYALQPKRERQRPPVPWAVAAAAYALGEYQKARMVLRDYMQYCVDEHYPTLGRSLSLAALLLAHDNDKTSAVEILGLAFTHLGPLNTWLEKWQLLTQLRADLEAELGSEVYQAAWERGKQLDLETVVQELLTEFSNDDDGEAVFTAHVIAANERLPDPLTERELEILQLIAAGLSNREIADRLVVSINTVKTHLKNLFSKIEVTSRTQAILRAQELGLV
jgi:predicted ATPase/DNA-binding CsgD family transcriptional regulator